MNSSHIPRAPSDRTRGRRCSPAPSGPAGQIPTTADGRTPTAIGDQVRVALDNLEATLHTAGGGLHTLLKATVYLADLSEFDEYNTAYLARLDGIPLPPRTTVEVARFRGDKRIEIDGIAAVDPAN